MVSDLLVLARAASAAPLAKAIACGFEQVPFCVRIRRGILVGAAVIGSSGCGGAKAAERAPMDVREDTVSRLSEHPLLSDTAELAPELVIGGTDSGDAYTLGRIQAVTVGAHGDVFVADGSYQVIRQYNAGKFIRSIGRAGAGPGEFTAVMGMSVSPDGRLLVRDMGSSRVNVYDSTGRPLTSWQVRVSETFGGTALRADANGGALVGNAAPAGAIDGAADNVLIRISPNGSARDTMAVPAEYGRSCPRVYLPGPVRILVTPVPRVSWTIGPDGSMIVGCAARYAFDVLRPNGHVLRVQRSWTPLPISKEQRKYRLDDFERRMRVQYPGWRWPAAQPAPSVHPAYSALYAADDGRFWALVPFPGEKVKRVPRGSAAGSDWVWENRYGLDIFDSTGVFIRTARLPQSVRLPPEPFFRGDSVWAATVNADEVPTVTKFVVRTAKRSR